MPLFSRYKIISQYFKLIILNISIIIDGSYLMSDIVEINSNNKLKDEPDNEDQTEDSGNNL